MGDPAEMSDIDEREIRAISQRIVDNVRNDERQPLDSLLYRMNPNAPSASLTILWMAQYILKLTKRNTGDMKAWCEICQGTGHISRAIPCPECNAKEKR